MQREGLSEFKAIKKWINDRKEYTNKYTRKTCISETLPSSALNTAHFLNQPIWSRKGTSRSHPPALTQDALRASAWSSGHQYDNIDQLHDSWKNCMTSAPVARTIITFFTIPATGTRRRLLALTCGETVQGLGSSLVKNINKHIYI